MAMKPRRLVLGAVMSVVMIAGLCVGPAGAAQEEPELKLIATRSKVDLSRYRGRVDLDLGAYLAALNGPFELRVTRPVYSEPLVLSQIVRDAGGDVVKPLDGSVLDGWRGLSRFLVFEAKDLSGQVIRTRSVTFCPGTHPRERLNDDGPMVSRYPEGCYANPFSVGMIWGIDEGWATGISGYDSNLRMRLPEGRFDITVSIPEPYVTMFNIDPANASVTVRAVVKDGMDDCYHCFHRSGGDKPEGSGKKAPAMEQPDPSILPDLRSLPAWGIHLQRRRDGREFLTFGATVWTGGASSLVVEGFRRSDEDVMDAYQYFYDKGEVVGRSEVGTMEFDDRRGHNHWHFLQFAGYSLVGADMEHIVRSRKEAFCLAATDAIDMTLPNADWRPYEIGLGTACGSPGSLWVREVLPLGWGDTYSQSRPGQSFNVTKLPNGTYYIKVEANPGGLLHEQDAGNNVEYRKVVIRGKKGSRYVRVPPWNGIDSESHHNGGFMEDRA